MKIEKKYTFTFCGLSDKEKRNLDIYELLRKKKIISRTELSRTAGINIVSISNYIKKYIDKKLALECGVDVSTGGRKPELVELDTKESFAVGIEAGAGPVRAVMADLSGKTIAGGSAAHCADGSLPETIAKLIGELAEKSSYSITGIRAVGIGTSSDRAPSIAREVEGKLGIESFAGDPASCAAIAEQAQARQSGPMLYMHSDLGAGVLAGREEITRFEEGAAGSARYLEQWPSALGLVAQAAEAVKKGIGTSIVDLAGADIGAITPETVIAAAKKQDNVALMIVECAAAQLGVRAAYLVNIFKPAALVIGGGLEAAGELAMHTIEKTVRKLAAAKYITSLKILPASTGETAVSSGASLLAIREVFLNA